MLKQNFEELDATGEKGDFCFVDNFTAMAIRYGDDWFMDMTIIPIALAENKQDKDWLWDGNKEFPTLTPSILVYPYEGWTNGWHGFLTNGKLVTA